MEHETTVGKATLSRAGKVPPPQRKSRQITLQISGITKKNAHCKKNAVRAKANAWVTFKKRNNKHLFVSYLGSLWAPTIRIMNADETLKKKEGPPISAFPGAPQGDWPDPKRNEARFRGAEQASRLQVKTLFHRIAKFMRWHGHRRHEPKAIKYQRRLII